jgi:hypothetical protein
MIENFFFFLDATNVSTIRTVDGTTEFFGSTHSFSDQFFVVTKMNKSSNKANLLLFDPSLYRIIYIKFYYFFFFFLKVLQI